MVPFAVFFSVVPGCVVHAGHSVLLVSLLFLCGNRHCHYINMLTCKNTVVVVRVLNPTNS